MGRGVHAAVHDVVEELAVLRVLHDDEDAVGGLDDFVELGDGGVADQFEDVQFSRDALDVMMSLILSFSRILMATGSPVCRCTAFFTFPNVPLPIVFLS